MITPRFVSFLTIFTLGTAIGSTSLEPPSAPTGKFTLLDAASTGVDLKHEFPRDAPFALMTDQYSGGGVCIGDIDADGWPDLFFTNYNQGNRLYRNLGGWRFEDVSERAGVAGGSAWSAGASFVDIDNDGDLDLYVCVFDGPNLLYQNDGKGVFEEAAVTFGLDYRGPSVMMAFTDYDLDGDLDGYLVTHRMPLGEEAKPPRNSNEAFERKIVRAEEINGKRQAVITPEYRDLFAIMDKGEGRIELITAGREDVLFRNNGDGTFTNVSREAGISGNDIGLAATWWDANGDRYPDLYVSNDYKGPDRFYQNQKNGAFKEITRQALPHIPWLSMGSDFSDINRDGHMDFIATDMAATTHYQQKVSMGDMDKDVWFLNRSDPRQMMRNAVYLNTGGVRFQEAAFLTGLASSDWTWSPKFADLDNDGWEDLFITNGMSRDFMNSDLAAKIPSRWRSDEWASTPVLRQKNLAFRNLGDLKFKKQDEVWGLDQLAASYGAAYGDLDRDGDLDLVVMNFDDPVSILRNDINAGNRLVLSLRPPEGNRYGIGAEVLVETESGIQSKQLQLARGFMSTNEPILHFGLGQEEVVKKVTVYWPRPMMRGYHASVTTLENVKANQHLTLEPETHKAQLMDDLSGEVAFKRVQFPKMPAPHREKPFDDYARQPLLPMKHSQLGPGIAVGDANGDGVDDFYVGGAAGQPGQLVIMTNPMQVITKPFEIHRDREDMGALLFDADGDGDGDLYVVSGGVECEPGAEVLGDRLYLNDGKGDFADVSEHLPNKRYSGSGVCAADFDRDGDLDLFVGSRILPGRYPKSSPSQLLVNEKGRFTDKGETLALGMVTSGLWTDVNADGWLDLLVSQDWGPVKCFLNDHGTLQDATETSGLAAHPGWWNGLASRDLDGDGDIDFVATNLGLNTKYKASPDHPLYLYYGDMDGSGSERLIEAGYEADILYPKRGRSCSSRAMPVLAEKFKSYHQFASATLSEIYGDTLEKAVQKTAITLESGAFINNGQARFTFIPFPRIAQISQGFGIDVTEVNGDRFPDVYLVHNNFHPQPETGRFDSGQSQLLLGNGDGTFRPAKPFRESIVVPGDSKAVARMDWNRDRNPDWLISQNDGSLLAYETTPRQVPHNLSVRLRGKNAVGARLMWKTGEDCVQVAEIQAGGGYLSQSSKSVVFGFPELPSSMDELTIRWADGRTSKHKIFNESEGWTIDYPE